MRGKFIYLLSLCLRFSPQIRYAHIALQSSFYAVWQYILFLERHKPNNVFRSSDNPPRCTFSSLGHVTFKSSKLPKLFSIYWYGTPLQCHHLKQGQQYISIWTSTSVINLPSCDIILPSTFKMEAWGWQPPTTLHSEKTQTTTNDTFTAERNSNQNLLHTWSVNRFIRMLWTHHRPNHCSDFVRHMTGVQWAYTVTVESSSARYVRLR
jgi:hypothetical protein